MSESNRFQNMSLRFCIVTFEHVLELSGDERMFSGLFAPAYDFLVDKVWRFFPNASLMSMNKQGDIDSVTMMFDGCLGRLQRNESDVTIPVLPFPLLGNGLIHSTTAGASKVVIGSLYNNTAAPSHMDVVDAFNSFTRQLWSLTILTTAILTFVVFMMFRSKLLSLPKSDAAGKHWFRLTKWQRTRRCLSQALIVATANILKQHTSYSFRGKLLRRKIILLLFAVFSLLIMLYFSSMIKTEMVIQKRPETISSYEDLLAKPSTKPLWSKQLNSHWDFMKAGRNTSEGRIWERAKRIGIDSCFLSSEADIQPNIGPIERQEAVWLWPNYIMDVVITNICAFSRANGVFADVNMWARSDEHAREKLNVMMLSAAMHPDSVNKFNRIEQAEFEHHIRFKTLKRMEFSVFPNTGSKSVRDCVANRIIYPDYDIKAVHLRHYSRLFVLSAYCMLFCLLVLSSEMMVNACRTWNKCNTLRHCLFISNHSK